MIFRTLSFFVLDIIPFTGTLAHVTRPHVRLAAHANNRRERHQPTPSPDGTSVLLEFQDGCSHSLALCPVWGLARKDRVNSLRAEFWDAHAGPAGA